MYPNSHKCYHLWHNKWDICPKFSDKPVLEETSFDDNDFPYLLAASLPQPLPSRDFLFTLTTIALYFKANLQHFYASDNCIGHVFATEGFQEVAFCQYRVIIGALATTEQGESPPLEYMMFNYIKIQKYFGMLSMDTTSVNLVPLSAFFNIALKCSASSTIFTMVWDLDSGYPQYVLKPGQERPTLHLKPQRLFYINYCYIHYIDEPECWYDILVDVPTTLELFHCHDIHSCVSAILLMIQKGIGFHSVFPNREIFIFPLPIPLQ